MKIFNNRNQLKYRNFCSDVKFPIADFQFPIERPWETGSKPATGNYSTTIFFTDLLSLVSTVTK